jgi:FkbM family methyltransferase
MLTKARAWLYALKVARKHCVNWLHLLLKAFLDLDGCFRARGGGIISCKARTLLKQLVRLENKWQQYGDILGVIRFENGSLVIPNYFGHDYAIPFNTIDIAHPYVYLNIYPFDVKGEVVLDIGAYLGDTPLMWLYKGAKSVIAVEPVPIHFRYLKRNVEGLPVICLNAAVAVQLPKMPDDYVSSSYGLQEDVNGRKLDVPVVQLMELAENYRPTVMKLNCEGCEHFVLEDLAELPKLGVKKIAVQFHTVGNHDAHRSIGVLEEKLGRSIKTNEMIGTAHTVTVYWLL